MVCSSRMRFLPLLFFAANSLALLGQMHGALPPRSVSTSRQFIVYGQDAHLRGGVCDLAERMKKNVLALLQKADDWRTPIVISTHSAQAHNPEVPPASLSVSQTGAGLKIQLDLHIGPELNGSAIEREVLRAVYIELMYRKEPETPAGTAYVQPPEWLLEGTLALAGGRAAAGIAEGLSASVAAGNILPLEQLLRQQPGLLESPLRTMYRSYAAALVLTLTELPDGRSPLGRFLTDLPRATNDPLADLMAHFPALGGSAEQMQKNWTLSIARLASSEPYRLLSCEETERQLAHMLHIELLEEGGKSASFALEEFPKFIRRPDSRGALLGLSEELGLLTGRANPLYRPVITEYQKIAARLVDARTKKIPERLAEIRATREHISRRMSAIGDYLNWFEATQASTPSGAFRGYLKAAELALREQPHRHDPISIYLDAFEVQSQN